MCSLVIGGFFCLITFESDVVSGGSTIYVGSGPGNHTTSIQDAIDNFANDGDTVFVYIGTYYENVIVNKTINLTGENRDKTVINGQGIYDTVFVSADWVNVSELSITNSGYNETPGTDAGIEFNNVQNCSTAWKRQVNLEFIGGCTIITVPRNVSDISSPFLGSLSKSAVR